MGGKADLEGEADRTWQSSCGGQGVLEAEVPCSVNGVQSLQREAMKGTKGEP